MHFLHTGAMPDFFLSMGKRTSVYPDSAQEMPIQILLFHGQTIGINPCETANLVSYANTDLRKWP